MHDKLHDDESYDESNNKALDESCDESNDESHGLLQMVNYLEALEGCCSWKRERRICYSQRVVQAPKYKTDVLRKLCQPA